MWSVQCATYCYAACLVSLCNYKTIHSIAQPLSTQTENVKKHLSWFFCSSFTFKPLTFSTSEVYASRVGDGICDCCDGSDEDVTYDHEWERPTAIDCLCAAHISLDPPGPSGHSRKVQQHLQGRRQNRAKHGDTMWHNVTHVEQNLSKTYQNLLRSTESMFPLVLMAVSASGRRKISRWKRSKVEGFAHGSHSRSFKSSFLPGPFWLFINFSLAFHGIIFRRVKGDRGEHFGAVCIEVLVFRWRPRQFPRQHRQRQKRRKWSKTRKDSSTAPEIDHVEQTMLSSRSLVSTLPSQNHRLIMVVSDGTLDRGCFFLCRRRSNRSRRKKLRFTGDLGRIQTSAVHFGIHDKTFRVNQFPHTENFSNFEPNRVLPSSKASSQDSQGSWTLSLTF